MREIRIHGVSGTAPHEMLSMPASDDVERVTSYVDPATGFYRVRRSHDGEPGAAPETVRVVEAYSWGALTSSGASLLASLRRAGWLLLLPMALVNVAYWSRPGLDRRTKTRVVTAIAVRWAGLLLTMALIATFCLVGIDMIAWQCFRSGAAVCPMEVSALGLSVDFGSWLGFLRTDQWRAPSRRLVIGSLLPLVVLGMLWLLSTQSRRKYEDVPDEGAGAMAPAASAQAQAAAQTLTTAPLDGGQLVLRRTRMWQGGYRFGRQQLLHLAVGVAVVALTAMTPLLVTVDPGASGGGFAVLDWTEPAAKSPWLLVVAVLGLASLVLAFVSAGLGYGDGNDFCGLPAVHRPKLDTAARRAAFSSAVAAAAAYAGFVVAGMWLLNNATIDDQREAMGGLPYVGWLFVLVVALVTGLVFASRWHGWGMLVGLVPLVMATGAFFLRDAEIEAADQVLNAISWTGLAVAVLVVLHRSSRADGQAWGGAAPAVLLGGATMVGLIFTSAVVLGAANILNGESPVTAVASDFSVEAQPVMVVPSMVLWFATLLPLWVLAAGAVVAITWRRLGAAGRDAVAAQVAVDRDAEQLGQLPIDDARRVGPRLSAAYVHRGERLAGLLAVATAVTVLAGIVGASTTMAPWQRLAWLAPLGNAGLWCSLGLSVALLAVTSRVRSSAPTRRQVGILWDISTFWPRVAHPFAPPCYAERVVPEVTRRVREALADDGSVVVSAHSQGSTIAVAVVSRLSDEELKGVRLVTYGSQLRTWFGRVFSAVMGPESLGTAPQPSAWVFSDPAPDAPAAVLAQPAAGVSGRFAFQPADVPKYSLRARMQADARDARWVNLFRRSDPLAFRAFGEAESQRAEPPSVWQDYYVGELAPTFDLETHSRYPDSEPYRRLLNYWQYVP